MDLAHVLDKLSNERAGRLTNGPREHPVFAIYAKLEETQTDLRFFFF